MVIIHARGRLSHDSATFKGERPVTNSCASDSSLRTHDSSTIGLLDYWATVTFV